MHPKEEPKTYNMDEVAVLLGIGRNHAYELAKGDRLPVPVIRLGRRLVVARAQLDAVLSGPSHHNAA